MNIRNQMDMALDDAANEHLRNLFKAYFVSGDLEKLKGELSKVEVVYKNADKVLDVM